MKLTKTGETEPSVRAREAWRRDRIGMENRRERCTPKGGPTGRYWHLFRALIGLFGVGLRLLGLYERGVGNALDLRLTRHEFTFADLPSPFDGFRILQLSDLHVEALPGAIDAAIRLVSKIEADLCVLTGDYRQRETGPFGHILPAIRELVSRVNARHGVCAILGNHDSADMAEALEGLGITVLVNESLAIRRAAAHIHVCGTDDVHYYYTERARAALAQTPEGFKVALVHSAELADVAADCGFQLYLAGHTHGGQICLPRGRPILTHMVCHRRYASGPWRHGRMRGYTTTGVGVSALPVRFNCRGEVALITLRRETGKPSDGLHAAVSQAGES